VVRPGSSEGQKVAVYMGDDSRREYLYKFVSTQSWSAADAQAADRLAIGDKYLDAGTLYVARFNTDGSGAWLPLVFGQVPDRPAAGAIRCTPSPARPTSRSTRGSPPTRSARRRWTGPEWTATNYYTGEVYLTLTNNNAALRPLGGTDAANPRHYNDPFGPTNTAQFGNPNGHIIRLRETGDNSAATSFAGTSTCSVRTRRPPTRPTSTSRASMRATISRAPTACGSRGRRTLPARARNRCCGSRPTTARWSIGPTA
jgi:secreted PhoX family phosphatase